MERTDNDRASSSLSILGTASPEMNREHHETYSLFNLYTRATFITTGYWYFVYYMYFKGGKWELQFLSSMTHDFTPPPCIQSMFLFPLRSNCPVPPSMPQAIGLLYVSPYPSLMACWGSNLLGFLLFRAGFSTPAVTVYNDKETNHNPASTIVFLLTIIVWFIWVIFNMSKLVTF